METQGQVINVGQVAAIWISPNQPDNVQLVWYDTVNEVHRVYDPHTGDWKPLNPQIITDVNRSTLVDEVATLGGLPLGQFYNLLDTGTLAIAITTTKIFYSDTYGNYIVDDLQAHKQYYINSDNLYIDGTSGVWDTNSGQLRFSFTEQNDASQLDEDNDYIVIRHNNSGVWSWIKTKIKSLVPPPSTGNSIRWNNGFYFSFSSAIDLIKDVSGGIVGKDAYDAKMDDLDNKIQNQIPQQITSAFNTAKSYTDGEVTNVKIYDKQLPEQLVISQNPDDTPAVNTKLIQILGGIYSWIAKLKLANNINVGTGFNPNGVDGDVAATDSVMQAVEKLVFKTKGIHESGSWHPGTNLSWIIRNNTLFIRIDSIMENCLTGVYFLRCANSAVFDLGEDILQYIDTIFSKIDWMYIGGSFRQKWIHLSDISCSSFVDSLDNTTIRGVPINDFLSFNLCINENFDVGTKEATKKWCTLGAIAKSKTIFYNSAPAGSAPVIGSFAIEQNPNTVAYFYVPKTIFTVPLSF